MKYVVENSQDKIRQDGRRPLGAPVIALTLLAIAGLPLVSGFLGMSKSDDAKYMYGSHVCGTGGGAAAYQNTVYALVRNNCASCHSGSLRPFASPDLQSAFTEAQLYVNLGDIPSSDFMRKIKDAHCGAYCSDAGGGPAAMAKALDAWKAAGGGGGCAGGVDATANNVNTPDQALPSPLPSYVANNANGGTWARLRWPMDSISPGAVLEIQVQQFNVDGYRFKEPRLAAPSGPLYIKNIKVRLNGIYNPVNANYTTVESFVNPNGAVPALPNPMPYPTLSSDFLIMGMDKGAAQDKVSLSIEVLKTAPAVACKFLPKFQSDVLPIMAKYNCYSCHSGGAAASAGTNPARQLFAMTGTDDQLCAKALQRTNKSSSINSMFIRGPLNGDNNHPMTNANQGTGIITTRTDVIPSWVAWIAAEWGYAGGGGGGGGSTGVPLAPTFNSLSINVFLPKCAGCHNAGNAANAGGVDVTTYATLTDATVNVIRPGDSTNSILYSDVVTGNMPKNGTPLVQAELDAIKAWIDGGALNN